MPVVSSCFGAAGVSFVKQSRYGLSVESLRALLLAFENLGAISIVASGFLDYHVIRIEYGREILRCKSNNRVELSCSNLVQLLWEY